MPGTWSSSGSGENPNGQWLDPSKVERKHAESRTCSDGAYWHAVGLGAERPDRSARRLGQGQRQPGKGARQSGNGAPRNKSCQTMREPIETLQMEPPEFVLRVLLPLPPASMGPLWWKKQVADASSFGVNIVWQQCDGFMDQPVYVPLQHMWT